MRQKLLSAIAIAIICALSFAGCAKEQFEEPETEDSTQIEPQHRAILFSWGYDGDDMKVFNDGYIVESDVFVKRAYLDTIVEKMESDSTQTRQTSYGDSNKISRENFDIYIDYSALDGFNTNEFDWQVAFESAAAIWTSASTGCGINLVGSKANASTIITIKKSSDDKQDIMSSIPSNGEAGKEILINPNNGRLKNFNLSQKRMTAVHLVGHSLGLSHTETDYYYNPLDSLTNDIDNDHMYGKPENLIEGTEWIDEHSVMVYDAHGLSNYNLSDGDRTAMVALYPAIDVSEYYIDGPDIIKMNTATEYAVKTSDGSIYRNINWNFSISDAERDPDSTGAVSITVPYTNQSKATITAYIMYEGEQLKTIQKEVSIIDGTYEGISISGPSSIPSQYESTYSLEGIDNNKLESISWSCAPEDAMTIESGWSNPVAEVKFTQQGKVTLKASVKYHDRNAATFEKVVTVTEPLDFSKVVITGPEETFIISFESYSLTNLPPSKYIKSITWSLLKRYAAVVNPGIDFGTAVPLNPGVGSPVIRDPIKNVSTVGALIYQGQGTPNIGICFFEREYITLKATVVDIEDVTHTYTYAIAAEGNVLPNSLNIDITRREPYLGNTWSMGNAGIAKINGLEDIDMSLVTSMKWNAKSNVQLVNQISTNEMEFAIYGSSGGLTLNAQVFTIDYEISYSSVIGTIKTAKISKSFDTGFDEVYYLILSNNQPRARETVTISCNIDQSNNLVLRDNYWFVVESPLPACYKLGNEKETVSFIPFVDGWYTVALGRNTMSPTAMISIYVRRPYKE